MTDRWTEGGRRDWAGGDREEENGSCLVGKNMDQAVIWRPIFIQN